MKFGIVAPEEEIVKDLNDRDCEEYKEGEEIEDEEIDIRTCFGGVELYVPANVNVKVKSRNFFGGVGNKTFRPERQDIPTVFIVASNMFGGVDIKY